MENIKSILQNADSVLIGAGAGLSTSAGFTYSGPRFQKYFADFEKKNRPLIYISLGTIVKGVNGFFKKCFEAFKDENDRNSFNNASISSSYSSHGS